MDSSATAAVSVIVSTKAHPPEVGSGIIGLSERGTTYWIEVRALTSASEAATVTARKFQRLPECPRRTRDGEGAGEGAA